LKSNRLLPFCFLLPVFAILVFLASCKKDSYELGQAILPSSDTLNVKTSDTTTIIAYSILQDSVRTDETTTNMIGSIQDPVFGNTTAGFYSQFRLAAEAPDFGVNPVLDSIVLQLNYAAIYGDTNAYQNIKVYEISHDMNVDSTYYSVDQVSTYGNLLANMTFKPAPTDSVMLDSVKTPPHIRINLGNITHYLGNKILQAPTDVLASNASFMTYMKGLYIQTTPRSSGGSLIGISPYGSMSKLVVYFHNNAEDSLLFNLLMTSACARFNTFNHSNYVGAEPMLRTQVLNHDTTLGKEKLYLQGMGGIKIKIRIPHIKNYSKLGKIAINNAILIFKNYETDTTLKPPPSLSLLRLDSLGHIGFIVDENEGSTYFGGTYDKTKRTYQFRITRHIQQILNGTRTNTDLQLMVNDPSVNSLYPYRISLNGTSPSPPAAGDRIQLKIIYTKLR